MSTATLKVVAEQEMASSQITHRILAVTPEMAERWLGYNIINRPFRNHQAIKLESDMLSGRWLFDGAPIRFDEHGNLIDGQHRLTAVMRTGLTFPFSVMQGLPSQAQDVMDLNAKRTAADQLAFRGVRNSGFVAASVRLFLLHHNGLLFKDTHRKAEVTEAVITAYVDANHETIESMLSMGNEVQRNRGVQPSLAGAAALLFLNIDADAARDFFHLLHTGAGTEGHPIVTLDRRMWKIKEDRKIMSERDRLAMVIQAWNAWRQGRQLTRFSRPKDGWTAETYPVAI